MAEYVFELNISEIPGQRLIPGIDKAVAEFKRDGVYTLGYLNSRIYDESIPPMPIPSRSRSAHTRARRTPAYMTGVSKYNVEPLRKSFTASR